LEAEIASLSTQEAALVATVQANLADVSMFSVLPTIVSLREDLHTKLVAALVCPLLLLSFGKRVDAWIVCATQDRVEVIAPVFVCHTTPLAEGLMIRESALSRCCDTLLSITEENQDVSTRFTALISDARDVSMNVATFRSRTSATITEAEHRVQQLMAEFLKAVSADESRCVTCLLHECVA
jgi:hypothetical protein